MTNNSYKIIINNKTYLVRIPGDKTDKFINRTNEIYTYKKISGRNFCYDPVYYDIDTGIMVNEFIDCRTCDPHNWDEVSLCIDKLKWLHEAELIVPYSFNVLKK